MIDIHAKGTEIIKDNISFFSKDPLICAVCEKENFREEIRIGRGRLDAGPLEPDLHRQYIPTEEFGTVLPLLYNVVTCNHCYFSFLAFDNPKKLHSRSLAKLKDENARSERLAFLRKIVNQTPDFSKKRTMLSGLASYILAVASYNQYSREDAPTLRLAIATLRVAWICKLLQKFGYGDETDDLKQIFYRKASYLYTEGLKLQQNGAENYSNLSSFGPDTDKDYGFDGVVYISAWLLFHYGETHNPMIREKNLTNTRSTLSKVFGFGKASKEKPSALLVQARETFDLVEKELKKLMMA